MIHWFSSSAFFLKRLNLTQLAKAQESPSLITTKYIIKFANCCCIETTGCYLYWGTMETIATGFSIFPTSKASITHVCSSGTWSIPGCTDLIILSPKGIRSLSLLSCKRDLYSVLCLFFFFFFKLWKHFLSLSSPEEPTWSDLCCSLSSWAHHITSGCINHTALERSGEGRGKLAPWCPILTTNVTHISHRLVKQCPNCTFQSSQNNKNHLAPRRMKP